MGFRRRPSVTCRIRRPWRGWEKRSKKPHGPNNVFFSLFSRRTPFQYLWVLAGFEPPILGDPHDSFVFLGTSMYLPGFKDGTFYIITTCVYRPVGSDEGKCTNFIITATDVAGPWSDPHVIEGAPGGCGKLRFEFGTGGR